MTFSVLVSLYCCVWSRLVIQLSSIVSSLRPQAAETLNEFAHFSSLWNQVSVCLCVGLLGKLLNYTKSHVCSGPGGTGDVLPAVWPLANRVQLSDLLLLCEFICCQGLLHELRLTDWLINSVTKHFYQDLNVQQTQLMKLWFMVTVWCFKFLLKLIYKFLPVPAEVGGADIRAAIILYCGFNPLWHRAAEAGAHSGVSSLETSFRGCSQSQSVCWHGWDLLICGRAVEASAAANHRPGGRPRSHGSTERG